MAVFSYVDNTGAIKTVTANDAATALKTAPGIALHSGVQTVPPGQTSGYVPGVATSSPAPKGTATGTTTGTAGALPGSITSTSGTSRANETQMGSQLTQMSSPTYMGPTMDTSYLDAYESRLKDLEQSSLNSINMGFDSQAQSVADAQKNETGSTSVQVARSGGYLGNSGSGTGVLLNMAARHRNELLTLESKRQEALQAAREGFGEKSFALVQERLKLAKQYEQEANAAKQKFFTDTTKILNQRAIADAFANGAKTPQQVFDALGGKVSIEDIASYIDKAGLESTGPYSFTKDDTAKLLGSGLSGDDISQVQDYVNTHGYTDEFRNTLTARERGVLDSIYYPKVASTAGGVGGTLTIAEAKTLGLPISLIGRSQQQVIADLQANVPPSWFREYTTSQWADPSAAVDTAGLKSAWDNFRIPLLKEKIGAKDDTSTSGADSYDNY